MIRQPTADPFAWWREALSNSRLPRSEGDPRAGFYCRRKIKGGPLFPVHIYLEQPTDPETGELTGDETYQAEELGYSLDPVTIWTHCRPITKEQFDALVERHRVDPRMSNADLPIDLSEIPTRPSARAQF